MSDLDVGEIKDKIGEAGEKEDGTRSWIAIYISLLAVVLAVGEHGGTNAMKNVIAANIVVSDNYNFYQAKNIRQSDLRAETDTLQSLLDLNPQASETAIAQTRQRIAAANARIALYQSDPHQGDGMKELLAKAGELEAVRDKNEKQDGIFELAGALLQIAIVLASAGIVVRVRGIWETSLVMAAAGILLLLDAITLLVPLPFL